MSSIGYTVKAKGQIVGTFWCQDCASKTCDCFSQAREHAHALGRNTEVYGEHGGRECLLAFLHVPGGLDAEKAREDARWDARERAGEKRPKKMRRKAA